MSETASSTMTTTPLGSGVFQYTIALTNTSNTSPIGTFWFAWDDQPDTNFLISPPTDITLPTNWTDYITHNGLSDGYGIQWVANAATNDLPAGGKFEFSFESTDPPAQIFRPNTVGDINPGTSQLFEITSSFVYAAGPETDAGFNLVVPCFCAGTRILTAAGERPVEHLASGDLVPALISGRFVTVRWIGHRRIDCGRHANPAIAWPVRVLAHAFGRGCPAHDLRLWPDHTIYVNGALVPARYPINGITIVREQVKEVAYWHVELAEHELLVAEGLSAESYLDTGNRDELRCSGASQNSAVKYDKPA